MFVMLAFSLLSAVHCDRFAVSSPLSRTSAGPELLAPVSGYFFEQKSDHPTRHGRPEQRTGAKDLSYAFAASASQQEQLRGVEKVELSPVNTVEPERRISLMPPTINISSRMTIRTEIVIPSDEPERGISPMRPTIHMSLRMNTYAKIARIPREMNTYAIEKSEVLQNEHLRKNRVGEGVRSA